MALLLNAPMEQGRDAVVAQELIAAGWTAQELADARHRIANTPDLAKEVSYAGAITPAVFAAAREGRGDSRWCKGCRGTTYVNGNGLCTDCEDDRRGTAPEEVARD